jgi:carboxypeptidase C (cathepsin A)
LVLKPRRNRERDHLRASKRIAFAPVRQYADGTVSAAKVLEAANPTVSQGVIMPGKRPLSASAQRRILILALLCLLAYLTHALAQDTPGAKTGKAQTPKEVLSQTLHTLNLGEGKLQYQATAGTLLLKEEDGKTTASFFFIAYTKSGIKDLSKRPITFAFNGGPGSSSVWLHMGAFGPKRVLMGDQGEPLKPPGKLVDNESTLLDLTDLVFIDPVTTGYSRPAPGVSNKQFHGVQQDIESVGEFIRLYTTRYQRWASPKFLAGESYGTTRAANLVNYLQDRHGMNFNGVILVSAILNFQTALFDEGNDLPYPLFLPTYTATAWYHKKLPSELAEDLKKTLKEAEQFALGDYTLALMKGSKLSAEQRKQIAKKVSYYTGLSEDFVLGSNLRIPIYRFTKELLRKEKRSVGRFDSRYKGIDAEAVGDRPDYDPSYAVIQGAYTAMLNNYLRTELKYESDLPYEILTGRVRPWDFGNAKNKYLNVAPELRKAMTKNQFLRVFVANGYYDLATPYFATEYTFNHLELDSKLEKHVSMGYYEAGHMMYLQKASLEKLRSDLGGFIQSALGK